MEHSYEFRRSAKKTDVDSEAKSGQILIFGGDDVVLNDEIMTTTSQRQARILTRRKPTQIKSRTLRRMKLNFMWCQLISVLTMQLGNILKSMRSNDWRFLEERIFTPVLH
jgi:hypothetical protein